MSAILITINRDSLALPALVLSGSNDANDLGVVAFSPPALQARLIAIPDSSSVHGTEYRSAAWQQAILGFSWVPDRATNESDVQASYAEVAAAVGQFAFPVTTQVGGAPAQVWDARMGSIAPSSGGRTFMDLEHHNPVYVVTIPVYPIPGA